MQCKAKTASGGRCRNNVLPSNDYCHIHKEGRSEESQTLYCSFCGKSQHEVRRLVAGPSVFICDDCSDLCIDMLWDDDLIESHEDFLPRTRSKLPGDNRKHVSIEELGFKPRFNTLKFKRKERHCFFLCPFSEPFDAIYSDHVKPILETEGMTVDRADEIFGTQPIIEDIWESINSAELILADVTGKNPNVMYEIGMAHTIGKPVVIMTQEIEDVPFDLKHYRCIVYRYTPKGVAALESQISGTIRFIRKTNA